MPQNDIQNERNVSVLKSFLRSLKVLGALIMYLFFTYCTSKKRCVDIQHRVQLLQVTNNGLNIFVIKENK